MAFQLPSELNWRTWGSASFLVLADAALVAMIREANLVLLFAIFAVSFVGFWALHFEGWLRKKHPFAFRAIIGTCGVVFLAFVIFASKHAIQERIVIHKIKAMYADAAQYGAAQEEIEKMPFATTQQMADRKTKIDESVKVMIAWEEKTSTWLQENLGIIAKLRFLDPSNFPGFCWTTDCEQTIAKGMNRLTNRRRNLLSILENLNIYEED